MSYAPCGPLTAENLRLPQFQTLNESRIESFICSQKQYLEFFAAEGRTLLEKERRGHRIAEDSCRPEMGRKEDVLPSVINGMGFASPILKSRSDRRAEGRSREVGSTSHQVEHHIGTISNESGEKTKVPEGCITGKKYKTKIRTKDEEVVARLAERSEKRSSRRSIMNPKTSSKVQNLVDLQKGGPTASKASKSKSKKSKISCELALMKSFSAPNIGKERLTLKPGPRTGVFNKGKASIPISNKKKMRKDTGFSESKFLGKENVPQVKRHDSAVITSDSDSDIDQSSSSSSTTHKTPVNISQFFLPASVSENSPPTIKQNSGSNKCSAHSELAIEENCSKIWDIELGKSLPSDDCEIESVVRKKLTGTADEKNVHPSIFHESTKNAERSVLSAKSQVQHARLNTERSGSSFSSISPSQSASQRPVRFNTHSTFWLPRGDNETYDLHCPPTPPIRKPTSFNFRPVFRKSLPKDQGNPKLEETRWVAVSEADETPTRNMTEEILGSDHPPIQFTDAEWAHDHLPNEYSGFQSSAAFSCLNGEYDGFLENSAHTGYLLPQEAMLVDDLDYMEWQQSPEEISYPQAVYESNCDEFSIIHSNDMNTYDLNDLEYDRCPIMTPLEEDILEPEDNTGSSDMAIIDEGRDYDEEITSVWIDASIASLDDDTTSLEVDDTLIFTQGRSLLHGIEVPFVSKTQLIDSWHSGGSARTVEQEMSKRLTDHWLPQKL